MVTIEKCTRCDGCGFVVGTSRWEMPWKAWGSTPEAMESNRVAGMFRPRVCGNCEGAGTFLTPRGPVRRGLLRPELTAALEA